MPINALGLDYANGKRVKYPFTDKSTQLNNKFN